MSSGEAEGAWRTIARYQQTMYTLQPGDPVSLTVPHCDPTINAFDWYHCVRGDALVDIWPIEARGCAA